MGYPPAARRDQSSPPSQFTTTISLVSFLFVFFFFQISGVDYQIPRQYPIWTSARLKHIIFLLFPVYTASVIIYISIFGMNREYQAHKFFCVNAEFRVLICQKCQYAVYRAQVKIHLTSSIHRIPSI